MTHKNLFLTGVLAATLMVAGCGGGGGGGGSSSAESPIATADLSNLYGRLSLSYATDGVAKSNSVVFSSADLQYVDPSTTILADFSEIDTSRGIECGVLTDKSGYVCAAVTLTGTQMGETDYFLFQLNTNRQIRNGTHEYCSAAETAGGTSFTACANDLLNNPDSPVTGSVSVAAGATGAGGADLAATKTDVSLHTAALTSALQAALKAYKP